MPLCIEKHGVKWLGDELKYVVTVFCYILNTLKKYSDSEVFKTWRSLQLLPGESNQLISDVFINWDKRNEVTFCRAAVQKPEKWTRLIKSNTLSSQPCFRWLYVTLHAPCNSCPVCLVVLKLFFFCFHLNVCNLMLFQQDKIVHVMEVTDFMLLM